MDDRFVRVNVGWTVEGTNEDGTSIYERFGEDGDEAARYLAEICRAKGVKASCAWREIWRAKCTYFLEVPRGMSDGAPEGLLNIRLLTLLASEMEEQLEGVKKDLVSLCEGSGNSADIPS